MHRLRKASFAYINPRTIGRNLPSLRNLSRHLDLPIDTGIIEELPDLAVDIPMRKQVSGRWRTNPEYPNTRIRDITWVNDGPNRIG